ncbi:hypothetical protein AVEN_120617-1, partial [Araneus ventricosus]
MRVCETFILFRQQVADDFLSDDPDSNRSVDGGEGLFRARLLLAAGCPVRVPEGSPADTGRVLRGQGARTQLPQRVRGQTSSVGVVRKFGEELPAEVSSLSSDRGSKLR